MFRRECCLGQLRLQPLPALTYLDLSSQEPEESGELPEALTTMTSLRVAAHCARLTLQWTLHITVDAGCSPALPKRSNLPTSMLRVLMPPWQPVYSGCSNQMQQSFVVCHEHSCLTSCLPTWLHLACLCVQELDLSWNELRGLGRAWLGQMTELNLAGNLLTAVPPALVAATAMRQLHMHWQWQCR
jgi:Leucine Rich repeat